MYIYVVTYDVTKYKHTSDSNYQTNDIVFTHTNYLFPRRNRVSCLFYWIYFNKSHSTKIQAGIKNLFFYICFFSMSYFQKLVG
jgi:hypothetical protein